MPNGAANIAETPPIWLGLSISLIAVSAMVFVILRFGLLSLLTLFIVNFLLGSAALTLDTSKMVLLVLETILLIVSTLAVYGFWASRGGEPVFGRKILD